MGCCDEDDDDADERTGTVRGMLCLRWDFEIVAGKCVLDNAEMPASILKRTFSQNWLGFLLHQTGEYVLSGLCTHRSADIFRRDID